MTEKQLAEAIEKAVNEAYKYGYRDGFSDGANHLITRIERMRTEYINSDSGEKNGGF